MMLLLDSEVDDSKFFGLELTTNLIYQCCQLWLIPLNEDTHLINIETYTR
ncbi:hypothetical protein [Candidatus Hodgkinia cicadicola]